MAWLIKISQTQGGVLSAGTPGVARRDLWLNGSLLFEAVWDAGAPPPGAHKFRWILLDKPPLSATALVAAVGAPEAPLDANNTGGLGVSSVTAVPDVATYSYRLQLMVDGGGKGKVDVRIFTVRKSALGVTVNRGWRYNANGEQTGEANFSDEAGSARESDTSTEYIFDDIRANLGGGGGGGALPALPGTQFAVLMENPVGVTAWDRLTEDMILPAFKPTLAFVDSTLRLVEVGQTIATPAFTGAYTISPPDTAVLTDDQGTAANNVIATPTAFSSTGTFTKNTYGQAVTFTLTATKYGFTAANSLVATWAQKVYNGVSASAGPYDATFIKALTTGTLQLGLAGTITGTLGSGQHLYFAARSAAGTPTFTFGGLVGGFELIASAVSVTNAHGIAENYDVWRTIQTNLGTITVTVS